MNRLPIVTYHSIDDERSVISTTFETFRAQMQFLKTNQFQSVPASTVLSWLREKRPMPEKTVCLAFDDGFRNVYTRAFPILQQHGFVATVFLVSGYCGGNNDWPGNLRELRPSPLLSWTEAQEMGRSGIEFGSHTVTHPDLTAVSSSQVQNEILNSKKDIEDKLGRPASVFAYPYGRYNAQIKEAVREHFDGAFSTRLGDVRSGADPYAAARVDAWFVSDRRLFRRLATTPLAGYLKLRQTLRDVKDLLR